MRIERPRQRDQCAGTATGAVIGGFLEPVGGEIAGGGIGGIGGIVGGAIGGVAGSGFGDNIYDVLFGDDK